MQEPLEASLVRIRTTDGHVVGAGFLVGERHILTCAHVIRLALGLPDHPVDPPQGLVSLDFPLIPPRTLLTASVVQWCPPLSDGSGDIAGLELLDEPPVAAEVVRFALAEDLWEHPFRAFGFPDGYDDGVWARGNLLGRQATNWIQIEDIKTQGFAVALGFSGTPVWDTRLQGVVGMVVAASRPSDLKAAFVLPLDVLVAAWPLIEPVTRQRVFLSAAPADADLAARLTTDLEARDIVVWTELHTPGEDHADKEERVRQAIRAAQAVVLVVSSQSRSSRTVKEHLRLADLYQRLLILVWVGDDEHAQPQHYGWRETVWVDAHGTLYAAAIEAIEANLSQYSQSRTISGLLSSHEIPEQEPRNPYKGLRAFTVDDAGDFFGRDRLVDELVKDIGRILVPTQPTSESGRLLTIIGPSGSGKSSVVMAGLLPDLQHGALPGSESWVYLAPMVPGKHPIEALGLTLKPHFPDTSFKTLREDLEDDATRGLHLLATQLVKQRDSKVVLLVDQFEELFTQTEFEDERQRFIDLLITATTEPRGPLLVLLTLRADFYDRLLLYPELYQLIKVHQQPLLPMEVQDLRLTIVQPAALSDVQLTFEGNLVGDLLFEMQGQVGALPLLQFTLDQLFQKRSGHRLTLQAYREIGGVKGALSQHAEQTYAALPSEEHRRLARALFVRLIEPGATEQDTTRRRAALAEFTLDDLTLTRLMRVTIDSFIAARLLTTNEVAGTTTIEVSHEALIREWKRLAAWMHEARQDIPLQQAISEDVAEWERRGKPRDRLYRGSQLKEARVWALRNMPSKQEVTFLQASAAYRVRSLVSGVAVFLLTVLLVGIAGWFYLHQSLASVTNLNDHGNGSLRDAIAMVSPGSTISFANNLNGTITLTSGELVINKNLTIAGPGLHILSISGNNLSRVFDIRDGVTASISGLTIENGRTTGTGGCILNNGTFTLTGSTISGCVSTDGGGIDNHGVLTVTNSTMSSNIAHIAKLDTSGSTGYGGGIYNFNGTVNIIRSTIFHNIASAAGGGIGDGYTLSLDTSTIAYNTAFGVGGGINVGGGGQASIFGSTIYGNMASAGGNIYNTSPIAPIKLHASIVAGGNASFGKDILGTVISFSCGYNLIGTLDGASIQGDSTTPMYRTGSPNAGPLRDNGGPTQTIALLPGSPAIDFIPIALNACFGGSITCLSSNITSDQRGMKRPDNNEQFCDIGAYESSS